MTRTTAAPESLSLQEVDAVVVGAGFAGLYALYKLREELGLKVQVLDKAGGIGGTWYWNRYPGARCDSESYYYSYSFSPEVEQEWNWSERYPDHNEIRRYLTFVADKFDLHRDIRLSTKVTGATYDLARDRWTIRTDVGHTIEAQFLVTAVGCLSTANIPDIPGLEAFEGDWYHTGQWPHDGVDLTGKRVGQIGTGSTGIQLAPELAYTAKHLTVFQRTANFSIPARNAPLTEEFQAEVKENYRDIRAWAKRVTNGHPFDIRDQSALDLDDTERRKIYEAAWETGGLRFRAAFRDILTDKEANQTASDFIRSKIQEKVQDNETAETLTPRDHGFATKRPPIDTHYFETFNRSNVSLVDLKATPIEEITKRGIRTTVEEHDLDVIVFATGFDAFTGSLEALNISAPDGRTLRESWHAGPRTYLGVQTPGFPNLFMITGPGSPSVLCNMPVAIEQHVEWVAQCIEHMRKENLSRVEPTPDAADEWVTEVNRAANATLLPQASSSWYLGANVPGKPQIFLPYAGGMAHFADICEEVVQNDYRGFSFT
tara:strand:+ start:16096 stop:17727 length:1632 start_codon:yes stop_codon:yes gene_type:complete